VNAPLGIVRRFASDPVLLAQWNNEYTGCVLDPPGDDGRVVAFRCAAVRGGQRVRWNLTLTPAGDGKATHVKAEIKDEEHGGGRRRLRLLRPPAGRRREEMLERSLARLKGFAESQARGDGGKLSPPDKVALLSVYAGQFGSYTTLLWQVPALSLTAQAFLMTIVLGTGSPPVSNGARYAASALSAIIAYASAHLMHNQRARAINHAELAKRISYQLSLTNLAGGTFGLDDAVPRNGADAQNVWATNRIINQVWAGCLLLFMITDAVVVGSALFGARWFS
jgi:hypothetical protein